MRRGLSRNVDYGELGTRRTIERVRVGNPPPKVARTALLPDGLFSVTFGHAIKYGMPRPRRADEAGGLYHALNRGNLRATIFRKEERQCAFE